MTVEALAAASPAAPSQPAPSDAGQATPAEGTLPEGAPEGAPQEAAGGAAEDPVAARVAEVAARLEAKRAERQAARQAPKGEADLRLDPAALQGDGRHEHVEAYRARAGVDPIVLFEVLAELGERRAKGQPDPTEARLSKLEQQLQREREREAAAARAAQATNARQAYLAEVTADKYPLLAALDEDERLARGVAAARKLAAEGEDADAHTIAAWAEVELRKLASKLAAKGGEGEAPGGGEPRTLSGALGGESPEPPTFPPGEEGRRARALAYLEQL